MEIDLVHGEARLKQGVDFTPGNSVSTKALLCRHLDGVHGAKGFAGIKAKAIAAAIFVHGALESAAVKAHQILVQHIEGGAKFLGQLHRVMLTDKQVALFVYI